MSLTKKNHYNPCFWTAFWNNKYLVGKRNGYDNQPNPRDVKIFSLNLKSNKILQQKTGNVFFEKNAGLADITKDNVLDYCKRIFPEKYEGVKKCWEENPSDAILDFENHFTVFEKDWRSSIEKTIINRKIEDLRDKTLLSFFISIQIIRNHNQQRQIVQFYQEQNMAKFEMFLDLKHTISNSKSLMNLILPYLSSKWILYNEKDHKFPLSDNPVLMMPLHVLLPLAPDLLLEIDLKQTVNPKNVCSNQKGISYFKYRELKKRTIENSSREIIFGDDKLLMKIKKSIKYKRHLQNIKTLDNTSYKRSPQNLL